MKTIKIVSLLLVTLLASSCKQNNWLDWKTQNEMWLMQNAQQEGVQTTATGLQFKCIDAGPFANDPNAVRPDNAKMVTIKYSGTLINGYEFDAHENYSGYVNSFVDGFAEGLKKMREFGVYELYIPYYLGYGEKGTGTEGTSSHIPPYSTLIFHIELKDVF